MDAALRDSEFFAGLQPEQMQSLQTIARSRHLRSGEYLFLLGDDADRLYVVLKGSLKLCFPLQLRGQLRDITIEIKSPGSVLGWSALVKPYRFTRSAQATEDCELAAFLRRDLERLFDSDPGLGFAVMKRIAELMGVRQMRLQALWVRELQRAVEAGLTPRPAASLDAGGAEGA